MNKTTETTLKRWIAQAVGITDRIERAGGEEKKKAVAQLRNHLEGMAARLEELE